VFAGFWLAWSDVPLQWDRHLFSAVMVMVLLVVVVRAARHSQRLLALTAMGGTLAVLVVQLSWMPMNTNVLDYRFPRSEAAMEKSFADYGPGLTVQIADVFKVKSDDLRAEKVYQDVLFGSMYAVADVESLTAYSGVGFNVLDAEQCVAYQGSTCRDAWKSLWAKPKGSDVVLADLLRAETVVVQRELVRTRADRGPQGWKLTESTDYVNVWRRTAPLPWSEGRLSHVSGPVTIASDERTGDVGETVDFRRDGSGAAELTFARLAWPGYTAEIDGRQVPVEQGPAGLVTVEIPDNIEDGTLTLAWSPPGSTVSIAAAGLGLALAALLGLTELRRRRAGRTSADGSGDQGERGYGRVDELAGSAGHTGELRT
jgi:hypothetical protein